MFIFLFKFKRSGVFVGILHPQVDNDNQFRVLVNKLTADSISFTGSIL